MFKIQIRDFNGKWRDIRFGLNRFSTETAAWEKVASFDQDGFIDKRNHRVVKA